MSRFHAWLAAFVVTSMTGCDPQFNIAGAYFPAWLASVLGGLGGTWLLHLLFLRARIFLRPAWLAYPCIFTALACAAWLIFFSA